MWNMFSAVGDVDSTIHSQHGNRSTQVHKLNYLGETINHNEDAIVGKIVLTA